jgi:hypothetical protein
MGGAMCLELEQCMLQGEGGCEVCLLLPAAAAAPYMKRPLAVSAVQQRNLKMHQIFNNNKISTKFSQIFVNFRIFYQISQNFVEFHQIFNRIL